MKKIIFTLAACLLFIGSHAQIDECTGYEELYRGRHKINGMTYGHPYTTFDRHNGLSFEETLKRIRNRIINSPATDPVKVAYLAAYNNAITNRPADNNENGLYRLINGSKASTLLPFWGKNNAFVFLVGIDSSGNGYIDSLSNGILQRNAFRDRAIEAFEHLSAGIEHMNIITMDMHMNDMQHYAIALTAWAECYDLLKAAYEVPELRNNGRNPYGFGDADRNGVKCSPRNKLRKLARDFYWQNNGSRGVIKHATGWKKNHGIKAASAMLIVAQVLNDAGVETNYLRGIFGWLTGKGFNQPRPNYSPVNWNKLGYEGIIENLFVGEHWFFARNVPQSQLNTNIDEFSAFAEGPNYCDYGYIKMHKL